MQLPRFEYFTPETMEEVFSILQESEEKRSRSFFSFRWQPRWITVAAVAFVLLVAIGGTAAASTGSMPGDLLYPVKRVTEEVQLAFTFTNLGKAEAYARMADRRIEEIVYMANENDTEEIELLAGSLNTSLVNIAEYSSRQDKSVSKGVSEESEQVVITATSRAEKGEYITAAETADVAEAEAPETTTEEAIEETNNQVGADPEHGAVLEYYTP